MIGAGLAFATLGFGLLTQVDADSGLALIVIGSTVFSLGLAPRSPWRQTLIVSTAPPERGGAAAAISETSSELGGALGIAILGSIAAAVYRGQVEDAVPDAVPLTRPKLPAIRSATPSLRAQSCLTRSPASCLTPPARLSPKVCKWAPSLASS